MTTHTTRFYATSVWLPCGRVNFAREGHPPHDSRNESISRALMGGRLAGLPPEVGQRLEDPLIVRLAYNALARRFDRCRLVVPRYRAGRHDHSDPIAIVCAKPAPEGTDNAGAHVSELLIATHDGFIVHACRAHDSAAAFAFSRRTLVDALWREVPGRGDDKSVPDAKQSLRQYADKLLGGLTWFQINLLLEGVFNPAFKPKVFFASHRAADPAHSGELPMSVYFQDVVADVASAPLEEALARIERAIVDEGADLEASCTGVQDYVRADSIRAFCRGTLQHALQPLKWDIEQCRRYLLEDMLGLLHRHERPQQIEFIGDNPFRDANEDQLRGYVLLLSAKLPLLLNVGRYLESAVGEAGRQREGGTAFDYYHHWVALLGGIKDSLGSLEGAIAQAQRDRQLIEQERLRSEQEMLAEKQRVETRGIGRVSDWIFLLIYLLTLIAALPNFLARDGGGHGTGGGTATAPQARYQGVQDATPVTANDSVAEHTLSGRGTHSWLTGEQTLSARLWIVVAVIVLIVLIRRVFAQFVRHAFELDWRIDEASDDDRIRQLLTTGPQAWWATGMARRMRSKYGMTLTYTGARYEGFVENETLEKLYYEGRMIFRQRQYRHTRRRPRARCYVTYSIRHDKPSRVARVTLQNVKIICVSRATLTRTERHELIEVMFHTLVRECLEERSEARPVPFLDS